MKKLQQFKRNWNNHRIFFYGIMMMVLLELSVISDIYSQNPNAGEKSLFRTPQLSKQGLLTKQVSSQVPKAILDNFPGSEQEKLAAYEEYLKDLSEEDLKVLEEYERNLKQISDPDQASLKARNYFSERWQPNEVSFNATSEELLNFEESFQSIFFEDWISKPSYSLPANAEEESSTITSQDEYKEVTVKKAYDDGVELTETTVLSKDTEIYERIVQFGEQTITEKTTYNGQLRIQLIEPDLSDLVDLLVPIRSQKEAGAGATASETITESITVRIGLHFDLPTIDWELGLNIGIIRFRFWAYFETAYHFDFPVRIDIEFPKEVVEGEIYSLKCTLVPLDLPDYNEFELKFIFNVGAAIDVNVPWFKWVTRNELVLRYTKYCRDGHKHSRKKWRWVYRDVKRLKFVDNWINVLEIPVFDYNYHNFQSYRTPMAGEVLKIPLSIDIDILPIIANLNIHPVSTVAEVLSNFLECGFGLGNLYIHGDSVTGNLAITAGEFISSNNVGWVSPSETRSLSFRVPASEEQFLSLSVSNLVFHTKKVELAPEFFIRGKDLTVLEIITIPLRKWIGEYRFELGKINLGQWHIPSLQTYSIDGPSILPSESLDFAMNIIEVTPETGQGVLANVQSYDQLYEITLQNIGGSTDIIELDVFGLPDGYTATFDQAIPQYMVDSSPKTVSLLVAPPDHIYEAPGDRIFFVQATSLGKRDQNLPNATISKPAIVTIPEIVAISLSIDNDITQVFQVTPDTYLPIGYLGENLGNVNDTITVNATLYSTEILRTWESDYVLNPYGSELDQYYNGLFDFSYSKMDLFPDPGVYTLDIQATSLRNPIVSKKYRLLLEFTPYYDLETSITPQATTVFANWESNFTFTVMNTGNALDNYTIVSEGWNNYLTFSDKIFNLEPNEKENVTVTLRISNPEDVPPKDYNFRMVAISDGSTTSSVFSTAEANVTILAPDLVPPSLVNENPNTIVGFTIPQSPFSLGPSWEAFDEYPGTYTAYIDGLPYETNINWQNDSSIVIPVVGPINQEGIGMHNVTIVVSDLANNEISDQVWVNIVLSDTMQPIVIPLNSTLVLPANFINSHFITWNVTEEFLLNATITRNGIELPFEDFFMELEANDTDVFITKLVIRPGELGVGDWNYTLNIVDIGNNTVSSSIMVTITSSDFTQSNITEYPVLSGYLGRNQSISVSATEPYPGRYEFWLNTSLKYNESWNSNVPILFQVDELDLPVGDNLFHLYVYDLSGNLNYYQWIYNLQDIDAPTILSEPSDFTIYEHNYTFIEPPSWRIHDFDSRPGQFTILRDDVIIKEGNWTIGNPVIKLPLTNLSHGIYHFQAIFRDASGNFLNSRVVEVTVLDVLPPFIWPHDPISFEPFFTASWFEFYVSEQHLDSYQLYKNGALISEEMFPDDFPFVFVDLADLFTGYFKYSLIAIDESGNAGQIEVNVSVTDYTPPFIKKPADKYFSEGTTGHSIQWEILEANPHNFSLYRNGELLDSGVILDTNMTTTVDSLGLGVYEYVLIVYDDRGWSHSTSCYVMVVDITVPNLSPLSDSQLLFGDSQAKLVWKVFDLHPASYSIYRNDVTVAENSWNGEDIILQLVGWSTGTHNVRIVVKDTSGNTAVDEVVINLLSEEATYVSEKPTVTPGFSLIFAITILTCVGYMIRRKKRIKP